MLCVHGGNQRLGQLVEIVLVALRGRVPHAEKPRQLSASDRAVDGNGRAVGVDDVGVAVCPHPGAELPRGDPLHQGAAVGGEDVDGPARFLDVLDIDEAGRLFEQRGALVQEVVDVHAAAQALDDLPVEGGNVGQVPVEFVDRSRDLCVEVGPDGVQFARVFAEHPGQVVRGVGQGRPFDLPRGVRREVFPGLPEPVHQLVEAPPVRLVEDGLDALQGLLADPGLADLGGLPDHLELDEPAVEPLDLRDLDSGLCVVRGEIAGALRGEHGPLPDVAGRVGIGDVRARHPQGDLARQQAFLCRVEELVDAGHGIILSRSRCGRSHGRFSVLPNPCRSGPRRGGCR